MRRAGVMLIVAAWATALLWGPPASAADTCPRPRPPRDIAIVDVTVISMAQAGARAPHQTVLVEDGRIAWVGPAKAARVPARARRIDGRNRFLIPALADMHVHIEDQRVFGRLLGDKAPAGEPSAADVLAPYVANGVLLVFNLSASPDALRQKQAVAAGCILGPRMVLAPMIDGAAPSKPFLADAAPDPQTGRRLVREAKAAGYDAVKTYSRLSAETFTAIVDEARLLNLPVVGHLPLRGQDRIGDWLQPGFGLVAHTEEFAYQTKTPAFERIDEYAALAKARGVAVATTIALNERIVAQTRGALDPNALPEARYIHPLTRSSWRHANPYSTTPQQAEARATTARFSDQLVRALDAAGVPLLAGTDALVPGMAPGFGLHDELERLVAIGLTPESALRAATTAPARYLGLLSDRGTVETGKAADLLLLDGDPLANIANTRRIAAVIVGGRAYGRQALDQRMSAVARRHAQLGLRLGIANQDVGGFDDDH